MPVRSLNSSVLRWPDAETVRLALDEWAGKLLKRRKDILGIACLGSYARGDWGVGSDLDLLVIVAGSAAPPGRRGADFDTTSLPVPVDLIVYTADEWRELRRTGARFYRVATGEGIWLHRTPEDRPPA